MVERATAAQARGLTLIIARPGGQPNAFCEPVTTTSTPQPSVSNGSAPRPLIASTRISAWLIS